MQVVEGQQGPAVVSEAIVDIQQPQLVGQVAQFHGQGILAAVHHAGVHEGGERIDLVSDGDVAFWAGRAGAEEGDAVTLVLDAGVVGRDLQHRGAGGGRGSSRAGTEVRSGSPPAPVHPPEGLDPTSEASWSPGPDGATQTLKGSSSTPSARSEASQGPQRDQPEFHQQRASELEG